VSRFIGDVQSKRAAASTSWTHRFARKPVDAAIASLPSVRHAIAAMRIARRRVARPHAETRSAWPVRVIGEVPKDGSIIVITNGRTAPA
jgi:hypothetical protein